MKYMSFPSQEALEEMRSQRPHNLHYFISKPWIMPFSLILSCSPFVQSDCCFLRWKTLVWQPSKSHRTLKVTCIAVLFILILYPIWRWWSKGWELKEKLKEVCFGEYNNTHRPTQGSLLRIVLQLMPESRHITKFCIWKMSSVLMNLKGFNT